MNSEVKRLFSRAAGMLLMMTATTAWAADITQNTAVVINSSNKSTYHNKSITGTVPSSSYAGQHGDFISQGAIVVDGIELNLTIDGFTADYSTFNSSATTRASGISLVNGATLHLTLIGTNTLIGGYGGAGIDWYTLSAAGAIGANKAYLSLPTASLTSNAAGFTWVYDDETTSIRPTPGPSLYGREWYDLSGRKLDGKPTKAGLYIVNGKKVMIK